MFLCDILKLFEDNFLVKAMVGSESRFSSQAENSDPDGYESPTLE